MKRLLIISTAILLSTQMLNGQSRSVNFELLGSCGVAGVTYDSRFNRDRTDGLGFNAGIGFLYDLSFFSTFNYKYSQMGPVIPVEINYLLGHGKHQLELGLGARMGLVREKLDQDGIPVGDSGTVVETHEEAVRLGGNLIGTAAYRYTSAKGLTIRAGLKPNVVAKEFGAAPFLSIGRAF